MDPNSFSHSNFEILHAVHVRDWNFVNPQPRSTSLSSGIWTSHWTGDNYSRWEDLKYSISSQINLNIFGNFYSDEHTVSEQNFKVCHQWEPMFVDLPVE